MADIVVITGASAGLGVKFLGAVINTDETNYVIGGGQSYEDSNY